MHTNFGSTRTRLALLASLALSACAPGYMNASDLASRNQGPSDCAKSCADIGMRMVAMVIVSNALPGCVCQVLEQAPTAPLPNAAPPAPNAAPAPAPNAAPPPPASLPGRSDPAPPTNEQLHGGVSSQGAAASTTGYVVIAAAAAARQQQQQQERQEQQRRRSYYK